MQRPSLTASHLCTVPLSGAEVFITGVATTNRRGASSLAGVASTEVKAVPRTIDLVNNGATGDQ